MKSKLPIAQGRVIEALPNTQFVVQFDQPQPALPSIEPPDTIRCILSGKMRKNRIRVLVGELVTVEFPDGHGNEIGRKIYRGMR